MVLVFFCMLFAAQDDSFRAGSSREYYRQYRNYLYFGRIDQFGNFVPISDPSPKYEPYDISKGYPMSFHRVITELMMSHAPKNDVYEFRSNHLIPGVIKNGEFAPDIGGKIIRFSEYKYTKDARRIFNLPDKVVPKKEGEANAEKSQDHSAPNRIAKGETKNKSPNKPVYGVQPSLAHEYDFKLDFSVDYCRKYGTYLYYGKLDEFGNFVPSPTEKPIDLTKARPKDEGKYVDLMAHVPQKKVYEFRYRTLIPGTIEKGEFIPELDGKIIDFDEYKYSKDARPIYNLPGTFVPKGK